MTRRQYAGFIHRFAKHVGVGPAAVTRDHVREWIAQRIADNITLSTIKTSDLVILRVVLAAAKEAELLPPDHTLPTEGVSVPRVSATSTRSGARRGYRDEEAKAILSASLGATTGLYRWCPWLLATSGARVSEVVCLRPCDVREIDGVWCFVVTPGAGRHVKSRHSIRDVPIHPELIAQGFIDFVQQRAGAERLFFDAAGTRKGVAAVKPGKKAVAKLRRWIRALPGLHVGAAAGVDPNHAWRHRFKTVAMDAGIDSRVIDAVCGHAPASVGAGYGEVSIRAKMAALERFPAR